MTQPSDQTVDLQAPATPADQDYYWTAEWQEGERETLAELAAGRGKTFDTTDDVLRYLQSDDD